MTIFRKSMRPALIAAGLAAIAVLQAMLSWSSSSPAAAAEADARSARLLFRSGFEGSSRIRPPKACWRTGCWQDIDGDDTVTRFKWPPAVLGGSGRFLMLTSPAQITPDSIGSFMS